MPSNFGKYRVSSTLQAAWPQVERRRQSRGPLSGPSPVRVEAQARNLFDRLRTPRMVMLVFGIALFTTLIFVTGYRG